MAEYIDREAAIKEVYRFDGYLDDDLEWRLHYALKKLPAADVKPVIHAHFYVDEGCAYCSNCRNNFKKAILKAVKFCPMCGAQIEGYGAHPDAGLPPPYDLLREEEGVDV